MSVGAHRAAVWGIWVLLAIYASLQIMVWFFRGFPPGRLLAAGIAACWLMMILFAVVATKRIGRLYDTLQQTQRAHHTTRTELEQLQTQNSILQIVSKSVDVPLAFRELALRIAPLVPCDRIGLALLNEDGKEFQTYTARAHEERRSRPRPEVIFKVEGTAIGNAVRHAVPVFIHDTSQGAVDYLDINILQTAGFASALLVPLVSHGRAVGTLNVVSRKPRAFNQEHADTLLPIAEIFAVAHVAQQLQATLARYQTMGILADQTAGMSTEINSALQSIFGHCDLIERGYPDPNLQRDLAVIVAQAQRIASLLDRMRVASQSQVSNISVPS
jgi:transcriptional regulator with GAF, ATPase, and Fis domain